MAHELSPSLNPIHGDKSLSVEMPTARSPRPTTGAAGDANPTKNRPISSSLSSTDDRLTFREPAPSLEAYANKKERVASIRHAAERTVTELHCEMYEQEIAQGIRMATSRRGAPLIWFHDNKGRRVPTELRSWYSLLFGYPAFVFSPRNFIDFCSFKWMTWGEGRAQDMKEQIMKEQSNISLVAALVLTVAAAFLLNLITPDDHVSNFPSSMRLLNWIILNAFCLSVLSLFSAVLTSVCLMMAVEEVGTLDNFLVLEEWLGGWIQAPAKFFLYGMVFLCLGVCLWAFAILHIDVVDRYYFCVIFASCCVVGFPFAYFNLNLVSSVWLTIANGEETLQEGQAKSRRVQSITVDELKDELEKYIADAQGVENIDLATFKIRLQVVRLTAPGSGEKVECLIKLGQVTDALAEKLFHEKIHSTVEAALAAAVQSTGAVSDKLPDEDMPPE